jgi:hypothetical protein
MDEPLFLRDPFIMGYTIGDKNPEGVRTGKHPTEGR